VLHTAIPLFVTALGLSIGSIWPVHGLFWVMFGFCVVGAGVYTHIPSFWSLPGKQLSGTAAAVSVAIINSFGNLGGFVGPYLIGRVHDATGSFTASLLAIAALLLCTPALALSLRRSPRADATTTRDAQSRSAGR
jgi:ACS family tartrate transporter-like MFS transporter